MDSGQWEKFPSYYELFVSIREYLIKQFQQLQTVKPTTIENVYSNFSYVDILLIFVSSIVWTFARQRTERILKPLGQRYGLTPVNQLKMPDSGWKLFYYLCSWGCVSYILIFSGKYQFLQKPSTLFEGWSLSKAIPKDIYFFYIVQCGYYVHCLYAVIFMDVWRKDSFVMIIHHVSSLILLALSFAFRYHNIGCVVFFLHDICDIFLESAKLNVYFKIQYNKVIKLHEILANVLFLGFTIIWCVSRLYWFPLRVLYTGISDMNGLQSVLPASLLINSLLWVLQIINIYWSYFILQTLYRVVTGQLVDDGREYDVQEKFQKMKKGITSDLSNPKKLRCGNASSNEKRD